MQPPTPWDRLPPFEGGVLNVVIETPKGSRNKFVYDERRGLFRLKKMLPAGAVFPHDFGYVPGTRGGDGDPLDALVLMDEPAFPGCLVEARLVGAVEAEQTKEGRTVRNDRLIAVAAESYAHEGVRSLEDLGETVLDDIEHFFRSYLEAEGERFEPVGRAGPERARALVEEGMARA